MKKLLFLMGILLLGFALIPKVFASEDVTSKNEEGQEETLLQPEIDSELKDDESVIEDVGTDNEVVDEVTFSDQVKSFVDEWFTPIASALAGFVGSITVVLVFLNKIKKLQLALKESKELSDEERKKNEQELSEAKENLKQAKEQALESAKLLGESLMDALSKITEANNQTKEQLSSEVKTSLIAMLEENKVLTEEVKTQKEDIAMLKDLLILSISSNPKFAVSEHGQKMITLLDDKKVN